MFCCKRDTFSKKSDIISLQTETLKNLNLFYLSAHSYFTAVMGPHLFGHAFGGWDTSLHISLHHTGGGQQGLVQASGQVQRHWGGTNAVWTFLLFTEAWREIPPVVWTVDCCCVWFCVCWTCMLILKDVFVSFIAIFIYKHKLHEAKISKNLRLCSPLYLLCVLGNFRSM